MWVDCRSALCKSPATANGKGKHMLTDRQIGWALSHDWAVAQQTNQDESHSLIVVDRYTLDGKDYSTEMEWTGTFQQLRDWAGY